MVKPDDPKRGAGTAIALPFERPLKVLTPRLIRKIDAILASLGPSGQVRLIKAHGKLRFIQRVEIVDAVQPLPRQAGALGE